MPLDDPTIEPWDAYGQEIYAYWQGRRDVVEIIERDDGLMDVSAGPAAYFAAFDEWPPEQQEAMKLVRGRVLDVGCGAGRVSLYLQAQGHEVIGVDVSPLAIEVCRQRGVRELRLMSITQINSSLGVFDTIVMLGNNFGLFGNFRRARWLLRRWHAMTSPEARILAQTLDPYDTGNPDHLAYHVLNRQRGRMGGQTRIRVRFKKSVGPWFDYLFVSRDEMRDIVAGTGWHLATTLDSDMGPMYIAVLEKD
jgi:SAM-dependent methyltransferase